MLRLNVSAYHRFCFSSDFVFHFCAPLRGSLQLLLLLGDYDTQRAAWGWVGSCFLAMYDMSETREGQLHKAHAFLLNV